MMGCLHSPLGIGFSEQAPSVSALQPPISRSLLSIPLGVSRSLVIILGRYWPSSGPSVLWVRLSHQSCISAWVVKLWEILVW